MVWLLAKLNEQYAQVRASRVSQESVRILNTYFSRFLLARYEPRERCVLYQQPDVDKLIIGIIRPPPHTSAVRHNDHSQL